MAKEIPGWEPIVPTNNGVVFISRVSQLVDGVWYDPKNSGSLQKLVDEWEELLWSDYHFHTFVGNGGQRFGVVSDGTHAIRILKEWGKLDAKGNIIEEVTDDKVGCSDN